MSTASNVLGQESVVTFVITMMNCRTPQKEISSSSEKLRHAHIKASQETQIRFLGDLYFRSLERANNNPKDKGKGKGKGKNKHDRVAFHGTLYILWE
jgi:hypothetical protein